MRLVDADEFKEKLGFLQKECEANQNYMTGVIHGAFQCCIEVIDKQPTIEPVERGAWVEDICCNDIVICNACGNEAYFGLDEGTYVLFDYCPNCGAKMDAEVKQE